MSEDLFLLGRIGSSTVALPADRIEAVLQIDAVVKVPGAPPGVRGLVSIRSRVLVLIDSAAIAGEQNGEAARYMAIISVDSHSYALTLDAIEDVIALPSLQQAPMAMHDGWQRIAVQIADYRGETVLIVDPARLIAAASTIALPRAA